MPFNLLLARIYGVVTNYTLMAIPLFVFMGVTLQKSQLAEELPDVIGHAFGRLNGGMGIAIIPTDTAKGFQYNEKPGHPTEWHGEPIEPAAASMTNSERLAQGT